MSVEKVTDESNIESVFVNGKRVVSPVEINEKEGWVKVLIPKLPAFKTSKGQAIDLGDLEFEPRLLKGQVLVVRKEVSKRANGQA